MTALQQDCLINAIGNLNPLSSIWKRPYIPLEDFKSPPLEKTPDLPSLIEGILDLVLFEDHAYDTGTVDECARRCLMPEGPEMVVLKHHGLTVVSAPLVLEGSIVGLQSADTVFAKFPWCLRFSAPHSRATSLFTNYVVLKYSLDSGHLPC